jgi:hypothetical protein
MPPSRYCRRREAAIDYRDRYEKLPTLNKMLRLHRRRKFRHQVKNATARTPSRGELAVSAVFATNYQPSRSGSPQKP